MKNAAVVLNIVVMLVLLTWLVDEWPATRSERNPLREYISSRPWRDIDADLAALPKRDIDADLAATPKMTRKEKQQLVELLYKRGAAEAINERQGEEGYFIIGFIVVLSFSTIVLIRHDSPGWLRLYLRRKKAEERARIDELDNKKAPTD